MSRLRTCVAGARCGKTVCFISIDVIFGMSGQKLILRHMSGSGAEPYVDRALLAIREVSKLVGVHRGLDSVMKF